MKQTEMDKRLLEFHQVKHRTIAKLVGHLRRHLDAWAMAKFTEHGYQNFKIGYMPLLMNIHPEGITNNELAKKAKVTKQAMSKVVKELTEEDYIRTEIHGKDKRSAFIYLTAKGKKLVLTAKDRLVDLEAEYEGVLGKRKFAELKEMLTKLVDHHDEKMEEF